MKGHRACFRASLAAAAVGAMLLAGGCVILPRMAFPKTSGGVRLKELQAPVEVLRDRYGVPHIYARNARDLFFAQGYVHAQDRFWQMEFSRRAGAGRLSELFGKKLLETDIFLRTLGFPRVAREEYRQMDAESKGILDAYVAGVNAYVRDRKPGKIALEYSLLELIGTDFEVEEWKPEHSITWAKMMSQTLSANMDIERLIFELLRTAGVGGTTGFFAPYREDMPYIISDQELARRGALLPQPGAGLAAGLAFFRGGASDGTGTNSWVVSGKLTTTGKPILANDTHLGIQMPSIWYEVGLHEVDADGKQVDAPGAFQVRGFSFPGHPGVVIGHNARIAWGVGDFTDDVQDFYLERINPANPNQYLVDGAWKDMELVHERIDIQNVKEPFVHVVRRTRHGPIITDRGGYKALESYGFSPAGDFPQNLELSAVSLQWTAFTPGELLKSILALDRARSFQEFREALRSWDGPVQNITYADVDGNIGYQAAGLVPIRTIGQGLIPVPGWSSAYEWKGFVPFDELPSIANPSKGYIVAANNPAASSEFPYYLGSQGTYGYRARRIAEIIEGDKDKVSVDDVKAMQADTFDLAAIEIRKYLEGLDLTKKETSEYLEEKEPLGRKDKKKRAEMEKQVAGLLEPARDLLLAWDGRMDRKSGAAAIYGFFFLELIEETFRDQYPADRWNQIGHERCQNALYYLLQEPGNEWWDDARSPDAKETRDTILVRAFRQAVEDCIDRMGKKIGKWEWGTIHQAEFRSSTLGESGIGLIERVFNRGPIAASGGSATVNVARWKLEDPFTVVHIPAMREIIDLADIGSGWMMHAPGQSGHPRNRHYDDFIEPWRDVEYHPTLWERADVLSSRAGRLLLEPAR